MRSIVFIGFAILLFSSCKSSRNIVLDAQEPVLKTQERLEKMIANFSEDNQIFAGIIFVDAESEKVIIEHNANKFFTPASNTKLLTLLAAKKLIGDSIVACEYLAQGDSLFIRGTADPSFLAAYDADSITYTFLTNRDERIFIINQEDEMARFGSGWSWDDYPYYYQKENSTLPIYGNATRVKTHPDSLGIHISPEYMRQYFTTDYSINSFLKREELSNTIRINPNRKSNREREYEVPFYFDKDFAVDIMRHGLKKDVEFITLQDSAKVFQKLYLPDADSLYKHLMLHSDNFIAEQLIFQVSHSQLGEFNTKAGIDYILVEAFSDIPDRPRWVDGSGLSRYNLISPRSLIWILKEIRQILTEEQILNWFPSNIHEGTLSDNFKGIQIFAKTGSLSNNFCLSGYLRTDSGKLVYFSWMNNHYMIPYSKLTLEMAEVLSFVQRHY